MSGAFSNDPMLDMFIFETIQLIEQLEQIILASEKVNGFDLHAINEIFRIMHTIKGSSAMMMFNNISTVSHSMEDIFYFLREENSENIEWPKLFDLVLEVVDYIKDEINKIKNGDDTATSPEKLLEELKNYLFSLKSQNKSTSIEQGKQTEEKTQNYIDPDKITPNHYQYAYKATIFFEEGCEMENIRAYTIIHNIKDMTDDYYFFPEDIMDNDDTCEQIRKEGFTIYLKTDKSYEEMHAFFMKTIFLRDLELKELENDDEFKRFSKTKEAEGSIVLASDPVKTPQLVDEEKVDNGKDRQVAATTQSFISVNVTKLDQLMDLVGEMVVAEAMVIQNPDLQGLELDNFHKAARQLNKITNEIQDIVMSIRMVPLSATFLKMHRIVRDMSKKLNKEIELKIIGEDTEVDKNIIEHISDPLMHLVRNAVDHGIEPYEERLAKGKASKGVVTLEARHAGSDVLIMVKDDGRGLDKGKIYQKAKEKGLVFKDEDEMTDKEIFNFILVPGFSTKSEVSEFSGRGVGMDVVAKNIGTVGGSIVVDSELDKGTVITMKIPLTLAIIDGMNIKVGKSRYTIPTISIKEAFRPNLEDIITDPDGKEMIMVRGQCYPILRLHELYKIQTDITNITDGIIIMVEQDEKALCIFADELLNQQQVVVKSLPEYIQKYRKIQGLAGCTLLGDGSISLILDINELLKL